MSVYVGIDIHRKRSQLAVIDARGEVLANHNVLNGVEPILSVIGGLPPGTPAAFEATFGTGWLAGLLAFGASGVNETFATPVNPLDPGRLPGGSSSGSAVAVAVSNGGWLSVLGQAGWTRR